MSLSITNKSHLLQKEIDTLVRCNFNNEVIALDLTAEGSPRIISLARSEVTFWQLFLRLFGCGTLVKKEVYLVGIANHLNRYDWSQAEGQGQQSDLHQAYLKVCTLANKALYRKWNLTLYNNVATDTIETKVEYASYRGNDLLHRLEALQAFKWNPCLQVKHVHAILKKQYPTAKIRIEDSYRQPFQSETNLSKETLRSAHLYVENRVEPEIVPVLVPVPVPTKEKRTSRA